MTTVAEKRFRLNNKGAKYLFDSADYFMNKNENESNTEEANIPNKNLIKELISHISSVNKVRLTPA